MCKYRASKVFKAMLFTIIIGRYPNFQKLNDEKKLEQYYTLQWRCIA